MNMDSMAATRKVAILLLSFDQGLAAELLGRLPPEVVEQVTLEIASAGKVTREQQEFVLNQFKADFLSRPRMQPTGPETARELLERTLEITESQSIEDPFVELDQAGPFAFLQQRPIQEIRQLIEIEHSQTIALVMAQLPPRMAQQVLTGFTPARQNEIQGRQAGLGPIDPDTLNEIATLLKRRMDKLATLPNHCPPVALSPQSQPERAFGPMIAAFESEDGSEVIRDQARPFTFRGMEDLDEATLTAILKETEGCHWAIALKGCSEKLRQRIVRRLAAKEEIAININLNTDGPLSLSEISMVQQQIVAEILELEASGRIVLSRHEQGQQRLRERANLPMQTLPSKAFPELRSGSR